MTRIPVKVISDTGVTMVNMPTAAYHCVKPGCSYASHSKATALGHIIQMHQYTESDAIRLLNWSIRKENQ